MDSNFVFKIARRLYRYPRTLLLIIWYYLILNMAGRLSGVLLIIRFTKTWPAAFVAYLLKRPMTITFRNGVQGKYGWWDIKRILFILENKMSLSRLPNGIFEVNLDDTRIRAPLWNMDFLGYVFLRNYYDFDIDYQGKTILDIGAYIGDTALFFWRRGAAKVICYEPVEAFFFWLQQNISLNGINAETFNFGISNSGGEVVLPFSELDLFVGRNGGNKSIGIKTLTLSEVLHKHPSIDIVKLVCPNQEEEALNNLGDTELAMVPTWIIASYNKNLAMKLEDKFMGAGFRLKKLGREEKIWFPFVFEQVRNMSIIP
jgi:FkbM family methyltransferase